MSAADLLGTWEDDAVDRLVGSVPRAAPIEVQSAMLRSLLRQELLLARLVAATEAKAPAPRVPEKARGV